MSPVRRLGLVRPAARPTAALVGRVQVGVRRLELGGAGVDALEDRPHAERLALRRAPRPRSAWPSLRQPRVGEAHGLQLAQHRSADRSAGRARCTRASTSTISWMLRQEPADRSSAGGVDLLDARRRAARPARTLAAARASARRSAARITFVVVARAEALERDVVEARAARSPARAAPSAGSPRRCGRSPSPRRPTSSRRQRAARRRGISRRRSAGPW